jgi:hypothetical protein
MATSGTQTFTMRRDDIITRAYELIGKKDLYQAGLDAVLVSNAASWLNMVVQQWQAVDIHLWKQADLFLFPQAGIANYRTESNNTRFCTSFAKTSLAVAAASAAVTVTVASTAGIAVGSQVGILLDTGVLHWSVVTAPVTQTTFALSVAVPGAASVGAPVFSYAARAGKVLKITAGYTLDAYSDVGSEINVVNTADWQNNAAVSGGGTDALYWRRERRGGMVMVSPTPQTNRQYYKIDGHIGLDDFTVSTDEADYPTEWFLPLTYALASHIGRGKIDDGQCNEYLALANTLRDQCASLDREPYYHLDW